MWPCYESAINPATKTQIYFQQKRKCEVNKTATCISKSATASVPVLAYTKGKAILVHCVSKTTLMHQPILVIFDKDVAEKAYYQTLICYSTSLS